MLLLVSTFQLLRSAAQRQYSPQMATVMPMAAAAHSGRPYCGAFIPASTAASSAVKQQAAATRLFAVGRPLTRARSPSVSTFSPAIITVSSKMSCMRQCTRMLRPSAPVSGRADEAA